MKAILKWALPVLVMATIALVVSGVLSTEMALTVGIVLEVSIAVIVVYYVVIAARRYRKDRTAGLEAGSALENGLETFMPRQVARVAALEPRLWYLLVRWLFRRRELRAGEYGYNKRSMMGMLVALVAVSSPVELLLAELLIPWPVVKWGLGIAGVYGVLWLAGVVVSLRVLPHRLERYGLRINYGLLAEGYVPYDNMMAVETAHIKLPQGAGEGLVVPKGTGTAYISVGGRADVTIRLREPMCLKRLLSDTPPVHTIYLAADNPTEMAETLREKIGEIKASESVALSAMSV